MLFLKNTFLKAEQLLFIDSESQKRLTLQDREIKIEADLKLHDFFSSALKEFDPTAKVYSEESTFSDNPLTGKSWIIDPLDGSMNYHLGLPFYASSIGYWEHGQPVMGAIYDYAHKEFYYGDLKTGAFLNGSPIKVSSKHEHLIKATGIPSYSNAEEALKLFKDSLKKYKKLRWLGCASLSLAYVACARVDCYEEKGIKIWDVAAGIPLVAAAGGSYQVNFTSEYQLDLLAHNGCEPINRDYETTK